MKKSKKRYISVLVVTVIITFAVCWPYQVSRACDEIDALTLRLENRYGDTITGATIGIDALNTHVVVEGTYASTSYTWESSNPNVATISSQGEITPKGIGSTTIRSSRSWYYGTLVVTITASAVEIQQITFQTNALTLTCPEGVLLNYIISPSNATNKNVEWSSSNDGVASVSSSGYVIAKSAGVAVITVSNFGGISRKSATCTVTVVDNGYSLAIVDHQGVAIENRLIGITDFAEIYVTINGKDCRLENQIAFASSNPNVATVCEYGRIFPKGAGGASISVRRGDVEMGTIAITFTGTSVAISNIVISPSNINLAVYQNHQMNYTLSPSNATSQNISWESSNYSVASVSSSGYVTAKTLGVATITASVVSGSTTKTAICVVTVGGGTPSVPYQKTFYVEREMEYIISQSVYNLVSSGAFEFTITYDPNRLSVIDLKAQTYETESAGSSSTDGVEIISMTPGTIKFRINKQLTSGNAFSGSVNIIRFKAISNGETTVKISSS